MFRLSMFSLILSHLFLIISITVQMILIWQNPTYLLWLMWHVNFSSYLKLLPMQMYRSIWLMFSLVVSWFEVIHLETWPILSLVLYSWGRSQDLTFHTWLSSFPSCICRRQSLAPLPRSVDCKCWIIFCPVGLKDHVCCCYCCCGSWYHIYCISESGSWLPPNFIFCLHNCCMCL